MSQSTSGNITLNIDGLVTDINGIRGQVAALESRRYIVEESHDETGWYRVWSDGFIEQGGSAVVNNTGGSAHLQTITFKKPFTSVVLSLVQIYDDSSLSNTIYGIHTSAHNITLTSFDTYFQSNDLPKRYYYATGY